MITVLFLLVATPTIFVVLLVSIGEQLARAVRSRKGSCPAPHIPAEYFHCEQCRLAVRHGIRRGINRKGMKRGRP